MIGRTLRFEPSGVFGAVLALTLALAALTGAVVLNTAHLLLLAVAPLFVAMALLVARPRAVAVRFTAAELEVEEPALTLPYTAIEALQPGARWSDFDRPPTGRYPLAIVHADGVLALPSRSEVPTGDVLSFLIERLTVSGGVPDQAELAAFHARQMEQFGTERVWAFRGRHRLGWSGRRRGALAFCIALTATGLVWLGAWALGKEYVGWAFAGFMLALIGGIFAVVFSLSTRQFGPLFNGWSRAGLVLGPLGLAVVQGTTRGEMKWSELRDVRWQRGLPGGAILLVFEGANAVLVDVYDRPLVQIRRLIRRCWRGEG